MKKPRPQLVIDISDVSYYDIGMEDFLAMIKACIFDLDGTIGNTLDSMVYSVNLTLKEMNLSEISKEQCREFVGNGARVLMEKSATSISLCIKMYFIILTSYIEFYYIIFIF